MATTNQDSPRASFKGFPTKSTCSISSRKSFAASYASLDKTEKAKCREKFSYWPSPPIPLLQKPRSRIIDHKNQPSASVSRRPSSLDPRFRKSLQQVQQQQQQQPQQYQRCTESKTEIDLGGSGDAAMDISDNFNYSLNYSRTYPDLLNPIEDVELIDKTSQTDFFHNKTIQTETHKEPDDEEYSNWLQEYLKKVIYKTNDGDNLNISEINGSEVILHNNFSSKSSTVNTPTKQGTKFGTRFWLTVLIIISIPIFLTLYSNLTKLIPQILNAILNYINNFFYSPPKIEEKPKWFTFRTIFSGFTESCLNLLSFSSKKMLEHD